MFETTMGCISFIAAAMFVVIGLIGTFFHPLNGVGFFGTAFVIYVVVKWRARQFVHAQNTWDREHRR